MVEALLTLKTGNAPGIGRDRIRLLEAVNREGSISGGARAIGLTYKAAWDALDVMTRLFGRPLLVTRVGGRTGGGARLTPAGARLVEAFGRLEADLARAAGRLDRVIAGGDEPWPDPDGAVLRTSARNAFRGKVGAIRREALMAEVDVVLPDGNAITARVTDGSRRDLGLVQGGAVVALIKASFVDLAPFETGPSTFANRFEGRVRHCDVAGPDAEVILDAGAGQVLAATTTARLIHDLDLAPGRPVQARFHAAQVILAVS